MVTSKPVIVLASNSPRRISLLGLGGWSFHVRPSDLDESRTPGETPGEYVLRVAGDKARVCKRTAVPGEIIVAADTTVTIDGDILGKPQDSLEAEQMLRRLRGRKHQVCTGIAVLSVDTGMDITDACITDVPMRSYSDEEIRSYTLSGDPLDKAGAYAIQHPGFHPVESLTGCFASVMGLPLCHLSRILIKMKVPPKTNIAAECQSALDYDCPIWQSVLNNEPLG